MVSSFPIAGRKGRLLNAANSSGRLRKMSAIGDVAGHTTSFGTPLTEIVGRVLSPDLTASENLTGRTSWSFLPIRCHVERSRVGVDPGVRVVEVGAAMSRGCER